MKENLRNTAPTYYWASWGRAAMVTVPIGILMLFASYLSAHPTTLAEYARIIAIVFCGTSFMTIILGTTFIRIKNGRVFYLTTLSEWHSMDISDVKTIRLVSRFLLTKKASAVQIDRRSPGIFPGMLLTRDAFPDKTIIAIVSRLKSLNPSIELDEGVQEILNEKL